MTATFRFDVELPEDLERFQLPEAVDDRLQGLLDRQDSGEPLTDAERREAEGLVKMAELLTLLRLRADRVAPVFDPERVVLTAQG
jgi:hypothetical protein